MHNYRLARISVARRFFYVVRGGIKLVESPSADVAGAASLHFVLVINLTANNAKALFVITANYAKLMMFFYRLSARNYLKNFAPCGRESNKILQRIISFIGPLSNVRF